MQDDIQKKRHEYKLKQLNEQDVDQNPFIQFNAWFKMAMEANLPDANAMTLATVNSEGKPTARILLLKDYTDDGYCFFTNYTSRKGEDLKQNPYGAIVFFWPQLEKQIRIEGRIEKLKSEYSDQYFMARPMGSRRAAAVSPQSSILNNRTELEQAIEEHIIKYGEAFERPEFWGGYKLIPEKFEFWQGRENRLNDRIEYILKEHHWISHRLAP
ncbi:pyridoxamine 5'-phosphate oxidase [Ancylomarina euxinus]|uniref:Pyridoxine/pyridoxamine 5'-phosphate oxidase n=1 Tax=Ancylomarina euxinus TaxID=2283627 RepID=A0A425Y1Y6_9BACT|nr:pyridoxamine 5'-phosphate oxidase [Ancylomarina euxinus]MCZ4695121.1 pyridoxamine 5'-phosphate oxidase [Ancylomarina euxinus]MUP14943.1 pyridoxamine 5'-phosphate oxidase [Ancylomarina euxinus]RRG21836.1 pyridoxamine 5'-phosphate oxidase [Ancylomarina euxinus]